MNPSPSRLIRRALVIFGVVACLVAGAATIRAAATWTAAEAPLLAPPVSIATLEAELAHERERSAALDRNLAALTARAADLETALAAADERLTADQAEAKALRDRLAAATKRLARLNRELAAVRRSAAAAQAAANRATTVRAAPAPARDDGDEGDHEDEDDD
jgi:septal ring factor EnvC (AmiA/AmiB activator)